MHRLAVTGHRGLDLQTTKAVTREIRAIVAGVDAGDLVGVSCLADGADTIFAREVLDHGGRLVAIVPAEQYRDGLPDAHHPVYDALLGSASEVVVLDHVESTEQAHMDAGLRLLDGADELVAVWDGQPARGVGGTADVVAAAWERSVLVTIVWPPNARRQ